MDVEVSAQENISNLEDKIDCATNSESNESNAADVGTSLAPEGEDTRNSEEQEVVENEESIECVGKETVDVNDTGENSASKDSHEDESENTQDDENVKSQNVQNEESQDVDNEESQNVEKEASQNGETEESQNVQNDKSQNEETGDKEHEKNENSQEKETETIVNGDSEDIVHNDDRDSDKKMDIDENEDDDDDDFNPLLLCPDISMDVDESPVLTGSTDLSRGGDTSDPNSLFAPLFSTFVDEMTGAEISFNLTADEQQLREKLYGPNNPIQFTKIHCTACNVHLGSALAGQTNRFVHPLLKVLICKECYHFYTSGEFEKDEDGSELYCRWCGQGGQVLCCTMCEFVFCKKCIRINFGRKKLTQVRDSDEWKCFRCDISQLKALRAMCVEFFEYIRRETARAATYGDSDTVNKDLTSCCQAASKKRQAEPDKETEKEVVKRPKRRRNAEEDPDYNPYAQSEDRSDSPVPSTSGVKPAANTPKVTYQIKTPASRNEVSFPGQSPSTTVRIGNQVINVKSVGTPSQTPSPVVKNTAIRTPIVPAGIRVKPALTPRAAVQDTTDKVLIETAQLKQAFCKYSEESLSQALDLIRDNKMGFREASRVFGIPKTTLQDRINKLAKICPGRMGRDPILNRVEENRIVKWLLDSYKCGFSQQKSDILDTVERLVVTDPERSSSIDGHNRENWYKRFLRRHPKLPLGGEWIDKEAGVTEQGIRKWFFDLETYLKESNNFDVMLDPQRILSGDESGFSISPKSEHIPVLKDFGDIRENNNENDGNDITTLLVFTASGKIVTPCVVFKSGQILRAILDSDPSWYMIKFELGEINGQVFFDYMSTQLVPWLLSQNAKFPVIFFVNSHTFQFTLELREFCKKHDVILYSLPPNFTHIMQPKDLEVFQHLKREWNKVVQQRLEDSDHINLAVTESTFCHLLKNILQKPTLTLDIIKGFGKCGLYPFNINSVDFRKLVRIDSERTTLIKKEHENDITDEEIEITQKVLRSFENRLQDGQLVNIQDLVCKLESFKASFNLNES